MKAFCKELSLKDAELEGYSYFENAAGDVPFLGVVIHSRDDLYPALRVLLQPD